MPCAAIRPAIPAPSGRRIRRVFEHADELVRLIRASGDFSSGWRHSPKGIRGRRISILIREFFVRKVGAGADFAITQMFFFAEDYLRLRDAVAARGCQVPIIPGIMPVISVTGIERSVLLSGCKFPSSLADDLHAHADDKSAVRKIGVEFAAALSERLLAEGAPGLHFYTLERVPGDPRDLPGPRSRARGAGLRRCPAAARGAAVRRP